MKYLVIGLLLLSGCLSATGALCAERELCFNPRTHTSFPCPTTRAPTQHPPTGIVAGGTFWLRALMREYLYVQMEVREEVYQLKEELYAAAIAPVVGLWTARAAELAQATAAEALAFSARELAASYFAERDRLSDSEHAHYETFEERWGSDKRNVRARVTRRLTESDGSPYSTTLFVYACQLRTYCGLDPELAAARRDFARAEKALLRANAYRTEAEAAEAKAVQLRRADVAQQ